MCSRRIHRKSKDCSFAVCNAAPTDVVSQYDYVYDAAGRRVQIGRSGSAMSEIRNDVYGYNERGELVSSRRVAESAEEYAYDFDDIGNRRTSLDAGTNWTYSANCLNQYTSISSSAPSASPRETFAPQFDEDGNQMLIKTSTGVWQVHYNGENRPIYWSNGDAVITMSYDRMGRRVMKNGQRFVYDGYLQIANFESAPTNLQLTTYNSQLFLWDPTEKVATRPLVWNSSTFQPFDFSTSYYTHDGNKNVSEVVAENGGVTAHYEYAPFGAVTDGRGASALSNPWRFSSEYAEDDTATVYYNYRHYEPVESRWCGRDPIDEVGGANLYAFLQNRNSGHVDNLGLAEKTTEAECKKALKQTNFKWKDKFKGDTASYSCKMPDVRCEACNDPKEPADCTGKTEGTANDGSMSKITLCTNKINQEVDDYRSTLEHELIHAKDHCRFKTRIFTCEQAQQSEYEAYFETTCKSFSGEARENCAREGAKNSTKNYAGCD